MIDWIAPALGSPATFSVVSIGDKTILTRYGLSSSGLSLFVGLTQAAFGTAVLLFVPLHGVDFTSVMVGIGAGVSQGLGLALMFFMLKRAEVSRVIPVFQTSPIFVAIMAITFLGDTINALQALAIALAVFGAVLASSTRQNGGSWVSSFRPDPRFALLLLAAAMVGGSQILVDISADEIALWNTVTLRGWGMAAVALAVFARPSTFADLTRYFGAGKTSSLLFFTEGVLAVTAALLLMVAIARGPVALVGALFGARPAFLFIITLAMSRVAPDFLGESFQRDELVIKFMATAFVVTAIVLIAVS